MKWRPGENKWSAHEVAVHCADSETNAAARIRFLATEQDALIQGYDEADWARKLDYHALPIEPALAAVDAVRANTAALLRRLPESVWSSDGPPHPLGDVLRGALARGLRRAPREALATGRAESRGLEGTSPSRLALTRSIAAGSRIANLLPPSSGDYSRCDGARKTGA